MLFRSSSYTLLSENRNSERRVRQQWRERRPLRPFAMADRAAELAPVAAPIAAPAAAAPKPSIFERLRALNSRLQEQTTRLEAPRVEAPRVAVGGANDASVWKPPCLEAPNVETLASRQLLALLHSSSSCASLEEEEPPNESAALAAVSAARRRPPKARRLADLAPDADSSPCLHAENGQASPQLDEVVPVTMAMTRLRPITAPPSTATPTSPALLTPAKDPSRLIRSWLLSSSAGVAASAQEWPDVTDTAYRSWQHNTSELASTQTRALPRAVT